MAERKADEVPPQTATYDELDAALASDMISRAHVPEIVVGAPVGTAQPEKHTSSREPVTATKIESPTA